MSYNLNLTLRQWYGSGSGNSFTSKFDFEPIIVQNAQLKVVFNGYRTFQKTENVVIIPLMLNIEAENADYTNPNGYPTPEQGAIADVADFSSVNAGYQDLKNDWTYVTLDGQNCQVDVRIKIRNFTAISTGSDYIGSYLASAQYAIVKKMENIAVNAFVSQGINFTDLLAEIGVDPTGLSGFQISNYVQQRAYEIGLNPDALIWYVKPSVITTWKTDPYYISSFAQSSVQSSEVRTGSFRNFSGTYNGFNVLIAPRLAAQVKISGSTPTDAPDIVILDTSKVRQYERLIEALHMEKAEASLFDTVYLKYLNYVNYYLEPVTQEDLILQSGGTISPVITTGDLPNIVGQLNTTATTAKPGFGANSAGPTYTSHACIYIPTLAPANPAIVGVASVKKDGTFATDTNGTTEVLTADAA